MRKRSAAIVISVAVHLGAIAWFGRSEASKPSRLSPVAPPRVAVEPEPIAIMLLDDRTMAAILPATSVRSQGLASHAPRHATSDTAIATGHATTPEPSEPSQHSTWMTMRGAEVTKRAPEMRAGLSAEFMKNFLDHSQPVAPKEIASERNADDLAHDLDKLHDERWVDHATPEEVTAARGALADHRAEQAELELEPDGRGTKSTRRAFTAHVEADGTAHFADARNLQAVHLCDGKSIVCGIPIGATFDINDWAMRSQGQDPYASAKLKFLDDTRDERYAIGKRYRHDQLGHSAQLVQKNVAYLWAKTGELAARKQGLFDLWDECAETGDEDVIAGGIAARAFLVGFIRSELAGSLAYSSDELDRLNAHRRSKARFSPYADQGVAP